MNAKTEGLKKVKPVPAGLDTVKETPLWKTVVKYSVVFVMLLVLWRARMVI